MSLPPNKVTQVGQRQSTQGPLTLPAPIPTTLAKCPIRHKPPHSHSQNPPPKTKKTMAHPPLMPRETLSALLLSPSPPRYAIIDVRDDDHVGGHIRTSTHVPSRGLEKQLPGLVRALVDREVVVFHCALSQQRGPAAARRYLGERERGREEGEKVGGGQKVYVLEGGFLSWQEKYVCFLFWFFTG